MSPIQTETPNRVAGRVLTVAMYGLPADYNDSYPSRIAAVTLAQANAQSREMYSHPGSILFSPVTSLNSVRH